MTNLQLLVLCSVIIMFSPFRSDPDNVIEHFGFMLFLAACCGKLWKMFA